MLLTTQYLEEADALANRIVVIDHGRVIADGTPLELKEASRSARLEVTLAAAHPDAVSAIAPLVDGRVHVSDDGRRLSAGGGQMPPGWRPPWSGRSTGPGCWWTTSRCASRRSTTCSSPSPGAHREERTGDEDERRWRWPERAGPSSKEPTMTTTTLHRAAAG